MKSALITALQNFSDGKVKILGFIRPGYSVYDHQKTMKIKGKTYPVVWIKSYKTDSAIAEYLEVVKEGTPFRRINKKGIELLNLK
ncbi:MAG: hypothetical protein WCG45_05560 [bacterium]